MTRILVDSAFKSFFQSNPTGVFNGTTDPRDAINHAVLLVGYNNEEFHWTALNSWGESWGDKGLFRIAYGVADVGHPEDTYSLSDCFTTSTDPATVGGWSRPRPVAIDPSAPGCYLYTAVAKDSISGIADHFMVDILRLVKDNVDLEVIPLLKSPSTGRLEPQLQPPSGSWAGRTFRICRIADFVFKRVATVTDPPATQLDALLAVKAAIDPNGFVLNDWTRAGGAAGGYCTWQGITCDEAQNVTGIDLYQKALGGVLPGSSVWLGLPSLTFLWLVDCSLGGALPTRLHELPQLQDVILVQNNISSTLPAEWGAWGHLVQLQLWENNVRGELPPSWGANLTSLLNLDLSYNPLLAGSIPESWSGMTSLLDLRIGYCALSGPLPAVLPPALTYLDLGGNKLSGSIGSSGVTQLSKLQFLWLHRNALTGVLPESLADNLPALETLDLSRNMFDGPLPASESSIVWPAMRNLILDVCNFSGTIPETWGQMSKLQELYVSFNTLSGSLPGSLSALGELKTFWAHVNMLTGTIPAAYGQGMVALTELMLWNNSGLTSCIPREFEGRVNKPGSGRDVADITSGTGMSGYCAASNGTR